MHFCGDPGSVHGHASLGQAMQGAGLALLGVGGWVEACPPAKKVGRQKSRSFLLAWARGGGGGVGGYEAVNGERLTDKAAGFCFLFRLD